MEWTETSPGRWERPADSLERFFIAAGKLGSAFGQEHFALSFGVKIQTSSLTDLEAALKQTWKALRFELPQLAAIIDQENRYVYEAATAAAVDAWADETFVVSKAQNAAELFATERSLLAPPRLARLFFLPASSEIVVSTCHWRIDGVGSIQFLSMLLQRLAHPVDVGSLEWGKEVSLLLPSLDHVLSLPQTLPEAADVAQTEYLVKVGSKMPSISLQPFSSTAALSDKTGIERLTLSESLTSTILSACKKASFGPTAAVQAAIIAATRAQHPEDAACNYVSMGAFSLRNYLPAEMRNPDHSVAIYHTGLPFAITPSGSFSTDAAVLQNFYKTAMDAHAVRGLASMHNKLVYQFSQPPVEGAPIAADPAMSSLGLVDTYIKDHYEGAGIGKFDVSDYWLGAPINTGTVWMHLWTFKGQMTFSCLFNGGLYSSEQIRKWQEVVKAMLCNGLNVTDE